MDSRKLHAHNGVMSDRYLFIRLSALGDVVNVLAALGALRTERPDARVDWVVEDRVAPLLELVEGIDRVLVFPRRALRRPSIGAARALLAHQRQLREVEYDAAIDFQANLKGGMHLARARAKLRVGLDRTGSREGAHRFADVRVPTPRRGHRAARALALLGPLGVDGARRFADGRVEETAWPTFVDEPVAAGDAEHQLAGGDRPRIILHPGTSAFGAFKRWPAPRFAELAHRLSDHGAALFVSYGPGEEGLARAVVDGSDRIARALEPRHGLKGLVARLRRADLVIAADSGPLLVASALGVPTVSLFGPKDPAVYAPPFARTTVVQNLTPCAPCSLRRCVDPICMNELPVDDVVAAATASISSRD